MEHRDNGPKIKIPVQRAKPQLPPAEDVTPPLLTSPDGFKKPLVEAQAEAETEAVDWREMALRWKAEAVNARQQSERRAQTRIREDRRRLLARLLSVVDNLERALAHADEDDALGTGVQLVLDDLLRELAQEGVGSIKALGRLFDPALHEAVATDGSDGGTVVEVLQTGYTLDGELLRPARVVVGSLKS